MSMNVVLWSVWLMVVFVGYLFVHQHLIESKGEPGLDDLSDEAKDSIARAIRVAYETGVNDGRIDPSLTATEWYQNSSIMRVLGVGLRRKADV